MSTLFAIAEAAQRVARHHAELPVAVAPSLDGFREIAAELESSLTARGICQWLEAPNRYLHDERPLAPLLRGELQQVHAAAAAFSEGICV